MSRNDSKYFSTTKKGEIHELKEELNSQYKDKRKDAVKKVIAAMTVGKDVSSLFVDVLNCMQIENLELKKLVYLYSINYAKGQPDVAILAVNTFVKTIISDPFMLNSVILVFANKQDLDSYDTTMLQKYREDSSTHPMVDQDVWLEVTGPNKKGRVHDMSHSLVMPIHGSSFASSSQVVSINLD